MQVKNQTSVVEFILLGLTDDPHMKIPLFVLFLLFHIITLVGNTGIVALIISGTRLHTPMYFFLCNLSVSDICNSSVIAPKMLTDLLSETTSISFSGCAAQAYFFFLFVGMEDFLLSVMAYDRYAAICHPLNYSLIMDRVMCIKLATIAYLSGIVTAATHTGLTFYASFCGPNVIDHFYCDVPPLIKLSCSSTFVRETVFFAMVLFFGCGALLITMTSYIYIISTILQIPTTIGRKKTFSTCGSHLTALFSYLRLPDSASVTPNKVVSVWYTIVIPMLNPFIYSLRNQEVKGVIRNLFQKKCFNF